MLTLPYLRRYIILVVLAISVHGCSEENLVNPADGDYFPMDAGRTWSYDYYLTFGDMPDRWYHEAVVTAGEPVEINGKTYTPLLCNDEFFCYRMPHVRKSGSKYYILEQIPDLPPLEILFLDTDKNVGEKWYVDYHWNIRIEYTVIGKYTKRTIQGKEYDDVIEVQVGSAEQARNRRVHYFAKGVGEIYSHFPSGTGWMYGNLTVELKSCTPPYYYKDGGL